MTMPRSPSAAGRSVRYGSTTHAWRWIRASGVGGTPFEFRIGRHALRGRVDRVDRLPDGGYELIDVKTGPPREPSELQRDVQLALYDLAAREAWRIEPSLRSYYYVLDDRKVQLPAGVDADWVTQTVDEVGAGIEAEQFAPTPSDRACGWCDFRLACPAAER